MSFCRTPLILVVTGALLLGGCDMSEGIKSGTQAGDPVVLDYPIAYVERPLPMDGGRVAVEDALEPEAFNPGARLILKDRASPGAEETVIFPPGGGDSSYDIKDLSVSFDGKKLLFSVREDDEDATWNIWLYNLDEGGSPVRVIPSDNLAEEGHDLSAQYLPDDRILFTSTRQQRTAAILLDEGKPQYSGLVEKGDDREAFNLHVMEEDGSNIRQITFNGSHDLYPTVRSSGEVVYLRWDAMASHNQLSLYKVNPDGTQEQFLYGFHSQRTGTQNTPATFIKPLEMPDGRLLTILRERESRHRGGTIITIDTDDYTELNVLTNGGEAGSLAQRVLVRESVTTQENSASAGGYYHSVYPISDGTDRLLTSWSPCRIQNGPNDIRPCPSQIANPQAVVEALPRFGIWVFDPDTATQRPVITPDTDGLMLTDPVVFMERPLPTALPSGLLPDPTDLRSRELGILNIRSVYDVDGVDIPGGLTPIIDPQRTPPEDRQYRFLRLVKHVPIPHPDVRDFDNSAFGRSPFMRDILGYVPIEPDGSAMFEVPADVPFTFDLLDADGGRVSRRHDIWVSVKAGEQLDCKGCHTATSTHPHGRLNAGADSINPGFEGLFPNSRLRKNLGEWAPDPAFGETMAEYYARIRGPRTPSMDIIFTDDWTYPEEDAADGFSLRYVDIQTKFASNNCAPLEEAPPAWQPPTSCTTAGSWTAKCRATINYLQHIQPLWEADRRTCDEDDSDLVISDGTCINCHTSEGGTRIPDGQLELTSQISTDNNNFITSYVELLFRDNEQELLDGALVDRLVERLTGQPRYNPDGTIMLDANGNPVPEIEMVPKALDNVPMSPAGSRGVSGGSDYFFDVFRNDPAHADWLSPEELKLISEWLDIGAQYYNNPFAAPTN